MRPTRPLLLYGGVAVTALGFGLIALTWGRVAALESVALQLPYLVSGGLTGLGLVIVGATAVNVYAKQREGAHRERQTQQLLEILRQVTVALGGTLPAQSNGNGESAGGGSSSAAEPADGNDLTEELRWGE